MELEAKLPAQALDGRDAQAAHRALVAHGGQGDVARGPTASLHGLEQQLVVGGGIRSLPHHTSPRSAAPSNDSMDLMPYS